MTTLAEITLRVARLITDVIEGYATDGTDTSLTDTDNLTQINQYFKQGTVWMLSGANAGKVLKIKTYATNRVTFGVTLDDAIAADDRYAIAKGVYPYQRIVGAIRDALLETYVIKEAVSDPPVDITGDGETLVFTLPEGASQVVAVELEHPDTHHKYPSHHWTEREGSLIFDTGIPPFKDWIIHPYTRQDHPELIADDDEIDPEISIEWLRWKAAEYALYWAVEAYGPVAEYRVEERLNRVLAKSKGLLSRKPLLLVRSGA